MAGFKITIGLDSSAIAKDATKAAKATEAAFDAVDVGGSIEESARSGFEAIAKDAKKFSNAAERELDQLTKKGFFSRLHEQARTAFTNIGNVAKQAMSGVSSIIQNALGVFTGNLLSQGISKITDLLKDIPTTGIKAQAEMERLTVSLEVITGSAAAASQLKELKRVAIATPFEFPDVANAALTLQNFGFTAAEVEKNITGIADAAARMGKGAQSLDTLTFVLGQIGSRAKVSAQDMNQLASQGLPVYRLLAEQMGKSEAELRKFMDEGRVKGPEAARAIIEAFSKAPDIKGFAERQGKTFDGLLSTAKDAIKERMGEAAADAFVQLKETLNKTIELMQGEGGKKIAEALKPAMSAPIELINRALDALKAGNLEEFGKDLAKEFLKGFIDTVTAGLVGAFNATLGPLLERVRAQVSGFFTSLTNDIKALLEKLQNFMKSIPGLKNFISAEAAGEFTFQTAGFSPQGKRRVVTGKPGTTEPQLPNIIGSPGPAVDAAQAAAQQAADARARVTEFMRQTRINALTGGASLSDATIPGGLIDKRIEAVTASNKATEQGTKALETNTKSQKEWAAAILDSGDAIKEVFNFGLRATFEGAVASVIGGTARLRDAVSSAIQQIRSRVGEFLAQGIGNLLFGGGGGAAVAGAGGGGGGGGILADFFGGGGGGGGGGTAAAGGGFWSQLKSAFGIGVGGGPAAQGAQGGGTGGATVAGGAAAGLFGGKIGAFLGNLATAAPLLGLSFGGKLGGKSTLGQVLGAAGGLFAGGAIFAGVSAAALGASFATIAAIAGPAALIAAPLLIGAYFIGKANQRKRDEQQADAIWVNEREQTRAIIAAVNSDRIEGADALSQHAQIRASTISQLNQIKTKSVRESRLTNQLRDLDNSIVRELQDAVARQAKRRGIIPQLVPEFAGGGIVPGVDRGMDSVLVKARPGEVFLNQTQQARLRNIAGPSVFEQIGVPGFQAGGMVPAPAPDIHISLVLESDGEQLGTLVAKGLKTSTGSRATVRVMDSARRNGEF